MVVWGQPHARVGSARGFKGEAYASPFVFVEWCFGEIFSLLNKFESKLLIQRFER
jgi:hypothetical protein